MEKVQIGKLDDDEKSELMRKCFWLWSRTVALDYVQEFGVEKFFAFFENATGTMAQETGRKLIHGNDLRENIEGAMQLASYYYNELWGSRDGYAVIENESEGRYIFPTCAWYDKLFSLGKLPCDQNCQHECTSVMKALSQDIKVEVTKARPKGDTGCEFQITLPSKI
jgi:hypothetical protein